MRVVVNSVIMIANGVAVRAYGMRVSRNTMIVHIQLMTMIANGVAVRQYGMRVRTRDMRVRADSMPMIRQPMTMTSSTMTVTPRCAMCPQIDMATRTYC